METSKSVKLKHKFKHKKLILSLSLGAAVAVALMFARGISSADTMGVMRILSDSFFVSGVLILGVSGLSFVKRQGAFDMLIYSFSLLFSNLGFRRRRYNSYSEFTSRERGSASHSFTLGGLIILSLSPIFLFMYFVVG